MLNTLILVLCIAAVSSFRLHNSNHLWSSSIFAGNKIPKPDSTSPLKVMILGPPCSGKGTIGELIAAEHGLKQVSCGDVLRQFANLPMYDATYIAKFLRKGELVPEKFTTTIIGTKLSLPDYRKHGWLLDGYPRSKEQAEAALEEPVLRPDAVVVLNTPLDLVLQRGMGRLVDPVTKKVYHKDFNPPPSEVASRLEQRPDDSKEILEKRYRIHEETVADIIGVFGTDVHLFDSSKGSKDVARDISKVLNDIKSRIAVQAS